jgi:hypothetical protein
MQEIPSRRSIRRGSRFQPASLTCREELGRRPQEDRGAENIRSNFQATRWPVPRRNKQTVSQSPQTETETPQPGPASDHRLPACYEHAFSFPYMFCSRESTVSSKLKAAAQQAVLFHPGLRPAPAPVTFKAHRARVQENPEELLFGELPFYELQFSSHLGSAHDSRTRFLPREPVPSVDKLVSFILFIYGMRGVQRTGTGLGQLGLDGTPQRTP